MLGGAGDGGGGCDEEAEVGSCCGADFGEYKII